MCGRFVQHYTWHQIVDHFEVVDEPRRNLRPRYNIAPTTKVDAIRNGGGGREIQSMRWGLVPVWWKKELKEVPATFNARAETITEKPMWRSVFKKNRCIIPASGFYEWTGPKGDKQPHFFSAANGSPTLAIAGLWDRWKAPDGQALLSCTMVVTEKSEWMADYHDRMPVLLNDTQFEGWLDGSLGTEVLKPAAEGALREWPVDRR